MDILKDKLYHLLTGIKYVFHPETEVSQIVDIADNYYNKSEVDAKLVTVYKAGGQCTFAALPALGATYMGYVFDVSDAFTTTDSFLEGAGKAYPAHTNVAIVVRDGTYYYDANTGLLDGYATLDSPALTGTPTAPTAAQNDNSTKLATTAYVDAAVSCRNWQPGKAYVVGRVIESNTLPPGCIAQCTTAGTSGATEPTWGSTSGVTVTDGTCVWTLMMMKFRYDEGTGFSVDKYYSPKDGVMKNEIHEWGLCNTGIVANSWFSIALPLYMPNQLSSVAINVGAGDYTNNINTRIYWSLNTARTDFSVYCFPTKPSGFYWSGFGS